MPTTLVCALLLAMRTESAAAAAGAPSPDAQPAAFAAQSPALVAPPAVPPAAPPAGSPGATPGERRIALARRALAKRPADARLHVELAMALARRARETADPGYYDRAEEALGAALRLSPDDFEALKARAWVLLGKHEFERALELARALQKRMPDDLAVHGYLTDALVELGRYAEAEPAAQRLLDLRPGNVPGLTRGAYLRELLGDIDGALEFMGQALERTPPQESEDRAWILTQLAHLSLLRGGVQDAEELLQRALALFPDYHYALAQQARLRSMQGRHAEAAELLRRRHAAAPHPENLFDLAQALERAGRAAEARAAYAQFERQARAEADGADNANRELVVYYAGPGRKPAEALRLARREVRRRRDVATRDAYAWALHVNGRAAEARREIEDVLAVGVRDAKLLYHAGVIAAAAGDRAAARRHLEASLALNPVSEWAADARRAYHRLR